MKINFHYACNLLSPQSFPGNLSCYSMTWHSISKDFTILQKKDPDDHHKKNYVKTVEDSDQKIVLYQYSRRYIYIVT